MDENKKSEALAEETLDTVSGGTKETDNKFFSVGSSAVPTVYRTVQRFSNENMLLMKGICPFCLSSAKYCEELSVNKEIHLCSGTCGFISVE